MGILRGGEIYGAALAALTLFLGTAFAQQPPAWLQVQSGAAFSMGQCPCVRWTLGFQAASGQVEKRDFLISTQGLFQLQTALRTTLDGMGRQEITVGAIEALWKTGHVGLGFSGLQWSEQPDLAYSEGIKTGLYAIINILLNQNPSENRNVRLDTLVEWQTPGYRIQLSAPVRRHQLRETVRLQGQLDRLSGSVQASFIQDLVPVLGAPSQVSVSGSANGRIEVLRLDPFALGLNLSLSANYDPMRANWGLAPEDFVGSFFIDARWVDVQLKDVR